MRPFRWGSLPLAPGEIEGWRAWSVIERDGAFVLSSLTRAEEWMPGEPFVATCARRRHAAPGRRCSCGVYAAADRAELAGLGRIAGAAIGQVSLWGRVAEHSHGYRASAAYPARVRLVCVQCLSEGRGEPAVAIDADHSSSRIRLEPLCAAHAGERRLPPAAPVEASLRAAYRVDPVPDDTVRSIVARGRSEPPSHIARWAVAGVTVAALLVAGAAAGTRRPSPEPDGNTIAGVPALPKRSQFHGPLARNGDALLTVPNARSYFVPRTHGR